MDGVRSRERQVRTGAAAAGASDPGEPLAGGAVVDVLPGGPNLRNDGGDGRRSHSPDFRASQSLSVNLDEVHGVWTRPRLRLPR